MSSGLTSIPIGSSSAEPAEAEAGLGGWPRALGLAGWSAVCLLAIVTGVAVLTPWRRWQARWRRVVLRAWGRGLERVLRVQTVVEGTRPAAPFFLVTNHLSYLDIAILAAATPGRFVAKREVRSWPGFGLMAAGSGSIFIDRSAKRDAVRVMDRLAAAVAGGDGIIVFAEATSSPGHTVLPFRPALLEWAARTGYPVHYASVSYRTPAGSPPAHLSVCWWGDMTLGPHLLGLCRLPRIEATIRFGADPIVERDRKLLADRLQRAVAAQFTPVVRE